MRIFYLVVTVGLADFVTFKATEVGPMKAPASCQEYYDNNIRENGNYLIQPSLDYDPFNVTCKFNEIMGSAQTILFHEHEQPFTSIPGGSLWVCRTGVFQRQDHI